MNDEGIFEGRVAYGEALRTTLLALCQQGSREIFCVAPSFVDWPWSDPAVLDALTAWGRRGRTLHLMAHQYEDLRRRHPRFVQWRTTFDHCVDAREHEPEGEEGRGPEAALFAEGGEQQRSLRLLESVLARGVLSAQPAVSLRLRQWFDALAQRSEPAFPASTLGL
jgi:hypothetical protein